MEISKALEPILFRFTAPEDVELYGGQWFRYSEVDLIRKPARELIEIERALGTPVVDAMNGMRVHAVFGDLAAAWIGVREVDPDLAGDFDSFNPMVMLIVWEAAVPASKPSWVTGGKAEGSAPEEPGSGDMPTLPESYTPDGDPSPDLPSDRTDTVTLPTLPVAD